MRAKVFRRSDRSDLTSSARAQARGGGEKGTIWPRLQTVLPGGFVFHRATGLRQTQAACHREIRWPARRSLARPVLFALKSAKHCLRGDPLLGREQAAGDGRARFPPRRQTGQERESDPPASQ